LAKEVSAQGGGTLTAHGTLYKALARMADARLLDTTWEDSTAAEDEGRPRRRLYTVTAEGEVAYRAAVQQAAVEAARAVLSPVTPTVAIQGGLS
jgi:PadR family transcriptional regulator PadR